MNAPKLRFKEFNDEWKRYKLQDLCNIYLGVTYTPTYVKAGKIFISSKDISKGYLDLSESKYISLEEYNKISNNAKPKKGDVLFTRVGSNLGNPTVIETNADLTIFVSLGYLRVNKLFNNYFSKYWMQSNYFWHQIESKVAGGAKQNLNTGWISKFDINVPTISEQEKISKTLQLLDKKIELQSKKIENLKLFKLYTENSLLNSSNSIHWKKLKLNDILVEGNRKPVKNTNDFKKITIKLNLNGLEFNESKREMSDKRPFYIREENEIIIGKQNYFNGSIAIVTKEFSGCICSNAIMSFKVKEGYNLKYIYLYLSQKRYMKEREFLANGTGQKELSEKEFLKFTIKVPEDSVVNNITNIIDKINKKINFENNKLNKLIELKKGLMQNMFV